MNGFAAIVYDTIAKYDRRQPPSPRNQRIYQAVVVDCRRQTDVAADENISQRRVSQIVEKVALWRRSRADGPEVGRADPRKDRRTADQLDRERLEGLYVRSVRAFDDAEAGRQVTTVRKREGASGEATDTTTRELVPSVQHLKVAQRALEMIWKLNDRPQPHSDYPRMTAVEKAIDELVHLRLDVEEPGLEARSRNPRDLVCRLVAKLIFSNPAELEKIYLWADECGAPADPPKEAATGTAPTVAEGAVAVEVMATSVNAKGGSATGCDLPAERNFGAETPPREPENISGGAATSDEPSLALRAGVGEPTVPDSPNSVVRTGRPPTICPECYAMDPRPPSYLEDRFNPLRRRQELQRRAHVVCPACQARRAGGHEDSARAAKAIVK